MQFFIYYVLWPFIGGAGFCYLGLMRPEFVWYYLIAWFLPWVAWPIGTRRRRHMDAIIEEFKTEAEKAGQVNFFAALSLAIGPPIIMVLAAMLGTHLAPVYMEEVLGIDVQTRIEEIQSSVESD
jgi:hypothetical protein